MHQNTTADEIATHIKSEAEEQQVMTAEDPKTLDGWVYTDRSSEAVVSDGRCSRRYVGNTRFELLRTTSSASWYNIQLVVSMNHQPGRDDPEPGYVYGASVYVQVNRVKPVEERHSLIDSKDIQRKNFLSAESDTGVSKEQVLQAYRDAKAYAMEEGTPMDDPVVQKRIERCRRLWDEDAEEFRVPEDDNQQMIAQFE